jgi:DNA repair protein RadA/Sms
MAKHRLTTPIPVEPFLAFPDGKNQNCFQLHRVRRPSAKWQGQCPHCSAWNTLVEAVSTPAASNPRFQSWSTTNARVQVLSEVKTEEVPRDPSGIDELDRVLGGGIVRGAVILIGGDPGIGKSTLLLQALAVIGKRRKVLYVSGEESPQQIALRASRLAVDPSQVNLLAEIRLEAIQEVLKQEQPDVAVIDSIQTCTPSK